jgi:integrase
MTVLRAARSLLLSGISPAEALALRWSDVERACGVARVTGANARAVRLHADVANCLSAISAPPEAPVLSAAEGGPASLDSLSEAHLCAAHDAGLERAQEITPHALRLVRQRIRFADLARIVGRLPAALLAAYSGLAQPGARAELEAVNIAFPA